MAFRSNMSTQELVQWMKGCGVHSDDCKKLEDEKFTGGSFLVLDKEDFKELNCSFAGRKLLGKLLEGVKCEPESDTQPIPVDPPQSLPLCGTMVLSSDGNRPQGGSNIQPDGAAGGWVEPKKIWESRTILKVLFLNPPVLERWICGRMAMNTANVLSWAKVWNRPLFNEVPKFIETDDKDDADIRVKFFESGICCSMVGTDAQNITDKSEPTMCLNLKGHSQKQQKSLVIHEFGHALGLEHEHQRSDFWKIIEKHLDIDAIPKEEKQGKGAAHGTDWRKKGEGGKLSEYDPKSIMHYTFMIDWLNNKEYQRIGSIDRDSKLKEKEKVVLKGILERNNSFAEEPSETDFNFLEEVYGGRPVGKTLLDGPEASNHRQPARIRTSQPKKVVEVNFNWSDIEELSNGKILPFVDDTQILIAADDIEDIFACLKDASANWDRIATKLHISPNKVQELRTSNHSSETRLHMVLTEWLNLIYNYQRFGQPTWREVARCVDGINNVLFQRIAEHHLKPGINKHGQKVIGNKRSIRTIEYEPAVDDSKKEQSVDGGLCDSHLKYVGNAIWNGRSRWKNIGRELGVDEGTIDTIRGDDDECLYKVLSVWIRRGKATIYDMLKALESPSVARSDIANEIRSFQGKKRADVGLPVSA